jgi:ribosome-binding factor A
MPVRPEKVAMSIKKEMARLIQDLNDPRIGFVTVTDVQITNDLRFCRIFVSVMGDETSREKTFEALEHAQGFLRKAIADKLRFKFVPEIVFRADKTAEYKQKLDKIFDKINSEKSDEHKKNSQGT